MGNVQIGDAALLERFARHLRPEVFDGRMIISSDPDVLPKLGRE